MLAIDFSHFFLIVLAFAIGLLALAWGRDLWLQRDYRWKPSEAGLVRCRNCGFMYFIPRLETDGPCPACSESNRVRRSRSPNRMSF